MTESLGNNFLLTILTPKAITNNFIRFVSRTLSRTMPMKAIDNYMVQLLGRLLTY